MCRSGRQQKKNIIWTDASEEAVCLKMDLSSLIRKRQIFNHLEIPEIPLYTVSDLFRGVPHYLATHVSSSKLLSC
jgi:hypothetical protein